MVGSWSRFPFVPSSRKNNLFEFVSPHHLHCPGELLAKARGENLFRDENAMVRRCKEVGILKTSWSIWPSAGLGLMCMVGTELPRQRGGPG